jgi:CheY-like chemotaxis protein/anti-sigma regulatory factor (Ser/Thr protein kinase)
MAKILVVDDTRTDRVLAKSLLERRPGLEALDCRTGLTALEAAGGEEALEILQREAVDLVLTDLMMPGLNGLELVETVRSRSPTLPVILMTAHGSEEIAMQALQKGAASYVPKRNLARDLLETVEEVLRLTSAERGQQRLLDCLTRSEAEFRLDNDPSLIPALVGHVCENLRRLKCCTENERLRVTVALSEALINAIYHGNLEVCSDLREQDEKAYRRLLEERRHTKPYTDRRIHVHTRESATEACYVIRDEGPGFDPTKLPDPTDAINLERISGRGLLLIRTFMDEVRHNDKGNEIVLIKRRRMESSADGARS